MVATAAIMRTSQGAKQWLLLIPLAILAISIGYSRGERLSSGFVLETSSDPASTEFSAEQPPLPTAAAIVTKYHNDPNTKIITDVSSSGSEPGYSSHSNNESKQYSAQGDKPKSYEAEPSDGNNQQVTGQYQSASERPAAGKRLKDGQQDGQLRSAASQQYQQYQAPYYAAGGPQQRVAASSTARPAYNNNQDQSVPKTEERLLISISANHDDDDYRPPRNNNNNNGPSPHSGAGGRHNDQPAGPAGPGSSFNPNKKPSITISIQDANANKHQGGGHTSAVIVRPGEDGQSIVIATVAQNHSIKPGPGGGHSNQPPPYREPANPHPYPPPPPPPPSTTTYRPAEYQPPASSRPVHAEQPQKPPRPLQPHGATTDERPHRPSVNELDNLHPNSGGFDGPPQASGPVNRPPPSSANQHNGNNNNNQPDSNEPAAPKGPKYPLSERNCGIIQETRIVGGDVANPDDFLWMAAIIKSKPKEGDERPFCGGSLITRRHILTAAHCLEGLTPRDVLVRLGSYDFDEFTASSLSADYAIDQFRVPAQYNKKTHVADIAIMRLKTPLAPTDNYKTVCMPQPRRSYVGALGTVTGYGSQSSTFRRAAPTLRKVTVPIWENRKCSLAYKKNLTESFLCAGYEEGGADACQGDSGGPLMTEGPNEGMMVVGIVSHGIGCGSPGYPGVYTRTSTFLDWIEKNTRE